MDLSPFLVSIDRKMSALEILNHPAAWRGEEVASRPDFLCSLKREDLDDLSNALRQSNGRELDDIDSFS